MKKKMRKDDLTDLPAPEVGRKIQATLQGGQKLQGIVIDCRNGYSYTEEPRLVKLLEVRVWLPLLDEVMEWEYIDE